MFRHTICFSLSYSFPRLALCCWPVKDASSTQVLALLAPKMALALKWSAPCCFTDTLEDCVAMMGFEEQSNVVLLKLAMLVGMA